MWSHYANNHSGLVLAFDERHEFFRSRRYGEPDDLGSPRRLIYSSERPIFDPLVDMSLIDNITDEYAVSWVEKMFFQKARNGRMKRNGAAFRTLSRYDYVDLERVFILGLSNGGGPLWYGGPEHQYGRPASFFHQLEDLNLSASWEKVEMPVLVMHGEYDWIMSRDDHELIAEMVNSKQAGRATFVKLPKTDHLFMTFENMSKAFKDEGAATTNLSRSMS